MRVRWEVWTEFVALSPGTRGGPSWTHAWTFGFRKKVGSFFSNLAIVNAEERLRASELIVIKNEMIKQYNGVL
jgi:hypothetical protein